MDEVARKPGKPGSQLLRIKIPSIRNGFRPVPAELPVALITTAHGPVTGNAIKHRSFPARGLIGESNFQLATRISNLANDCLPPVPPRTLKIDLLLRSCQIEEREHVVCLLRSKNTKPLPQIPTLDLKCSSQRIETFLTASVGGEKLLRNSAGLCTCPRVTRLSQYARSPS
jgi:hypothetical protein